MNYSQQQADPRRHLAGFSFVLLIHALVVYALVTGLGKKVIDVVRAPIETKVIEEIKKPTPPPPEIVVPPPPRLEAPPPPFIPPPEVQIATPPPVQNTIAVATATPPPAPVAIAPMAAAAAPAAPAVLSAAVVCSSNFVAVMGDAGFPREAMRQGIEKGDALIQFTLSANGSIKEIRAVRASHPIFARHSMRIVGEYKCQGQGQDVLVEVPFRYKID